MVASLRFQGGVPPDAWETGLTPSEWRSRTTPLIWTLSNSRRSLSNFKLVRSYPQVQGYFSRISSYSAAREDKLRAGTMHIEFQCLLNEFTDDTDLQYHYHFGDPALSPQMPADLHHYVTHMFRCHFQSEPTTAPAFHHGTMSWDSLKAHSCENVTDPVTFFQKNDVFP